MNYILTSEPEQPAIVAFYSLVDAVVNDFQVKVNEWLAERDDLTFEDFDNNFDKADVLDAIVCDKLKSLKGGWKQFLPEFLDEFENSTKDHDFIA